MQKINFRFVQYAPHKNDGTRAIYLRVSINRKSKYLHTNLYSADEHFNWDMQLVYPTHPHATIINKQLTKMNELVQNYIYECNYNEQIITAEKIFKAVSGNDAVLFTEYATENIKNRQLCKQRLTQIKLIIKQFNEFAPNVKMTHINEKHIIAYHKTLLDKKYGHNTILTKMKILKSFTNAALKDKIIKDNPFIHFTIGTYTPKMVYLNQAELSLLEQYTTSSKIEKSCIDFYLLGCYTGLRISDLHKLNYGNIQDNCIVIKQGKTSTMVKIPINKKIEKYIDHKRKKVVTCRYTDITINRYLKAICKAVGITKPITFHSSRHTFATIGVTKGIPVEIISKLLGHRKLATTQIYAKVEDEVLIKNMQKYNELQ